MNDARSGRARSRVTDRAKPRPRFRKGHQKLVLLSSQCRRQALLPGSSFGRFGQAGLGSSDAFPGKFSLGVGRLALPADSEPRALTADSDPYRNSARSSRSAPPRPYRPRCPQCSRPQPQGSDVAKSSRPPPPRSCSGLRGRPQGGAQGARRWTRLARGVGLPGSAPEVELPGPAPGSGDRPVR